MHLEQMAYVERMRREGERVDLMLKFTRAAAAGVYGKPEFVDETIREFLARAEAADERAEPALLAPGTDAYMAALKTEYRENEQLNAGYDERMAAAATLVYLPPPVGAMIE